MEDKEIKTYEPELDISKLFPEAIEEIKKVIHLGGMKYGYESWKDPDNVSHQHKANHASCFRHLSESSCNPGGYIDPESGADSRAHLILRQLQAWTRDIRGYNNHDD